MLAYEKKGEKEKKKGIKKNQRSGEVIQAKYMNRMSGQLQFPPPADRPPETISITDAKNRARDRQRNLPPADQLAGFTAHHKYPWSNIRNDIELTFTTIPKTGLAEKTLKRLERFSGCFFPVQYDNFVADASRRRNLYDRNEEGIDNWIQEVCWTPSNIFIGPLSNEREDDPGHRNPVTEIDAHYVRSRRMSDVSAYMMDMYKSGGLQGDGLIPDATGRVSLYEPGEWQKDVMAHGTQYYQMEDPYYRDNIFHYQVFPNIPIRNTDYKLAAFSFSIETLDEVARVQLRYSKNNYRANDVSKLLGNPAVGVPSAPNKKRWDFTIAIAQGFIYNQFELAMKRDTGTPKIMPIQSIYLKKV